MVQTGTGYYPACRQRNCGMRVSLSARWQSDREAAPHRTMNRKRLAYCHKRHHSPCPKPNNQNYRLKPIRLITDYLPLNWTNCKPDCGTSSKRLTSGRAVRPHANWKSAFSLAMNSPTNSTPESQSACKPVAPSSPSKPSTVEQLLLEFGPYEYTGLDTAYTGPIGGGFAFNWKPGDGWDFINDGTW